MEKNTLTRIIIEYLNNKGLYDISTLLEKESMISSESELFRKIKGKILNNSYDEAILEIELNFNPSERKLTIPFIRTNQIFNCILEGFSDDKIKNFDNQQKSLSLIRKIISVSPKQYKLNNILGNLSYLLFIENRLNLIENMQKHSPIASSKEKLNKYLSNILCDHNKSLLKKFQSKNLLLIIKKVYAKQITECVFHNVADNSIKYSFFKDHVCNQNNIPYKQILTIDEHNEEILNVILSQDNEYLVIVLKTNILIVYKLIYDVKKKLMRLKFGKKTGNINENYILSKEEKNSNSINKNYLENNTNIDLKSDKFLLEKYCQEDDMEKNCKKEINSIKSSENSSSNYDIFKSLIKDENLRSINQGDVNKNLQCNFKEFNNNNTNCFADVNLGYIEANNSYQFCDYYKKTNNFEIINSKKIKKKELLNNSNKNEKKSQKKLNILEIYQICKIAAHKDQITSISFSSDSLKLLSSSKDKTIKVHEVKTGKLLLNISDLGHMVTSAQFYNNDTQILSTNLDSKIHIHDLNGTQIETINSLNISEMLISEKHKLIILSAPILSAVLIYDIETKTEKKKIFINDTIVNISLSQLDKGENLLINSSNLTPVISHYNMKNNNLVRKFFGHRQERLTTKCCFGGFNEKFIICGSDNKEIFIWNKYQSLPIKIIKVHSAPVNAIAWAFNERSDFLFSASDDHTLKVLGNENLKGCEYTQGKIYDENLSSFNNKSDENENNNNEKDSEDSEFGIYDSFSESEIEENSQEEVLYI